MKVLFLLDKSANNFREIIGFMEEKFQEIDKMYIVIDRRNEHNFDGLPNTYKINSYLQFLKNKSLRRLFFKCEKIIVSGIFVWQFVLLMFPKTIITKCYFQFWGGDYTRFRVNSFKNFFLKYIIQNQLDNIKSVILLEESEKEEFESIFKFNRYYFYIPVPIGPERNKIINSAIKIKSGIVNQNKRIIIGNSATETNHHIDIFKSLKNLKLNNIDILCPLSYGDPNYAKKVISIGYELFGENFFPIVDFMSFDKYIELLSTCDVGIYNHDRQQSLGNISFMIALGKKIYLRKNGPCWNHFSRFNIRLNDIDTLSDSSVDEIFKWNKEDGNNNYLGFERWRQHFYVVWNKILSD